MTTNSSNIATPSVGDCVREISIIREKCHCNGAKRLRYEAEANSIRFFVPLRMTLCVRLPRSPDKAGSLATTSRELCEKILKEAIAVAKKVGYDYGPDFFDSGIKYFLNAGAHKPSILIDLEAKRPTEIDFINQKILDYGIKYRVNTPYLDALTSIIRAIENKNATRSY